jgi:transposase
MRAYPQSLRTQIVAAFDNDEGSPQQLAQRFGVSRSFIAGLLLRRRRTGSFAALRGGPKPRLDRAALEKVRRWAKENPQPTLRELCARLHQERGLELSVVRMGKVLQQLGLAWGRGRPRLTGPALKVIQALAKQNPRATLREFCQRVREHCGVSVSLATMSLTLQRLGMAKGQGRRLFNEPALKQLRRLAQKHTEATVKEVGEAVERQCGFRASRSTLYTALKRLGLRRKRGRPRKGRRTSPAINGG